MLGLSSWLSLILRARVLHPSTTEGYRVQMGCWLPRNPFYSQVYRKHIPLRRPNLASNLGKKAWTTAELSFNVRNPEASLVPLSGHRSLLSEAEGRAILLIGKWEPSILRLAAHRFHFPLEHVCSTNGQILNGNFISLSTNLICGRTAGPVDICNIFKIPLIALSYCFFNYYF